MTVLGDFRRMATEDNVRQSHTDERVSTKGITLLDDEDVIENVVPSRINWWGVYLLAVLALLAGLALLINGEAILGFLLLVVTGILGGYVNLARKRSRYIVTNQRVKKSVGLLRRQTGETRIRKIRGLTTERSLFERIAGKGSVMIDSGAAGGRLGIQAVPDPDGIANTIRDQQRRLEEEGETTGA